MPADLTPADRAALENVVRQLEAAWNAMDGSAFAAPFADDADFVTIRGEHFRGRPAIAAGHAAIFQTIYAGSTNSHGPLFLCTSCPVEVATLAARYHPQANEPRHLAMAMEDRWCSRE